MIQLDQRQLQAGMYSRPRVANAEEVEFWTAQRPYRTPQGVVNLWVCQCMNLPPTGPRAVIVWSKDETPQSKTDAQELARLLVTKYVMACKVERRKPEWIDVRKAPRDVERSVTQIF